MGVLLFLEIWLQHFPEDFLIVATRMNSKFVKSKENKKNYNSSLSKEFTYIEEFPPSPHEDSSEEKEENTFTSNWTDNSDDTLLTYELMQFLRGFYSYPLFQYLGGKVTKIQRKNSNPHPNLNNHMISPTSITGKYIQQKSTQELIALSIPEDSQLQLNFPVISSLLEVLFIYFFCYYYYYY